MELGKGRKRDSGVHLETHPSSLEHCIRKNVKILLCHGSGWHIVKIIMGGGRSREFSDKKSCVLTFCKSDERGMSCGFKSMQEYVNCKEG